MEGGHSDKHREHCLYRDWMHLQEQELHELVHYHSLNIKNNTPIIASVATVEAESCVFVEKVTKNFQEYVNRRSYLARSDASAFFSPTWCTTLENSMSWMAGCRPSSFVNLIYALCGADIETKLEIFLQGRRGQFPHLTTYQLTSIDNLQRRTIANEDRLTSQMATLQQEMSDNPLSLIAVRCHPMRINDDSRENIGKCEQQMAALMAEADKLRIDTFKELTTILKPAQALEYMIAVKKFRLCVQAWGLQSDREHGRG